MNGHICGTEGGDKVGDGGSLKCLCVLPCTVLALSSPGGCTHGEGGRRDAVLPLLSFSTGFFATYALHMYPVGVHQLQVTKVRKIYLVTNLRKR